MDTFGYVVVFSLLGGVVSLTGGIILLSKRSWADKLATYATSFAAGALLSAVFLDLLKEGIEGNDAYTVLMFCLVGMAVFFLAERFFRWFHHHHAHEDSHSDPTVGLVILGDTLHNALDGVAIAASFLISVPTGIVTTIAVATHEIPQEIGDFGVLLKKGLSRKRVIVVNIASALATTLAAVVTYLLGTSGSIPTGALLGLSAGFLLYIASSDLIPTIHEESSPKNLFDVRSLLFLAGIITVAISVNLAHGYIDSGHEHTSHVHSESHEDSEHVNEAGQEEGDEHGHSN